MTELSKIQEKVRAQIEKDIEPVRPYPSFSTLFGASSLGFLLIALLVGIVLTTRNPLFTDQTLLSLFWWAISALWALSTVLQSAIPGLSPKVFLPLFLFTLLTILFPIFGSHHIAHSLQLHSHELACGIPAALTGSLVAFSAFFIARSGYVLEKRTLVLSASLLGAATAHISSSLFCSFEEFHHLAIFHSGLILILGVTLYLSLNLFSSRPS